MKTYEILESITLELDDENIIKSMNIITEDIDEKKLNLISFYRLNKFEKGAYLSIDKDKNELLYPSFDSPIQEYYENTKATRHTLYKLKDLNFLYSKLRAVNE